MTDSIRELRLPTRIVRRLEYEGIKTISALVKRTPYELLAWPGFGLESYKAVHRALERQGASVAGGLSLKDDPGIPAIWAWITQRDNERSLADARARRRRGRREKA